MDREAWQAIVHGVARVGHDLVTKPPPYSWQSEGLWLVFLHSSIALPIQALRGLPCLESVSVVLHVRSIEGPSWLGPTL